ncbi:hypothetical protein [Cellulomonas sp. PhB150]|uniref:hypothetical protein n=1 Tax=Cellulomonas sp. PhB150 TaxID=2485188 RepID=UPI000F49A709|nr:hypothetical protein [Cellulomonas sp. PhB150]ROS31173.1 hypothetical protein EDF34_0828 [Cellulomonas sp. PhB150]
MRWEALFADMEAQLEAAERAGVRADVAELVRAERATVHLVDRLRAAVGRQVRVHVLGAEVIQGEVIDATEQWLLVGQERERRVLVPSRAIVAIAGLGAHAAPEPGRVERRLGLGHALRVLARDRAAVLVRSGDVELAGVLGAVGADHVEVVARDARGAAASSVVPFASLATIRTG